MGLTHLLTHSQPLLLRLLLLLLLLSLSSRLLSPYRTFHYLLSQRTHAFLYVVDVAAVVLWFACVCVLCAWW